MSEKLENAKKSELLGDRKVVEEINRHLWIESEKAGYNIGFDRAASDWLEKFSTAWMDYHAPKRKGTPSKSQQAPKSAKKKKSTPQAN